MAQNFPNSPTQGTTTTIDGKTWVYDGTGWGRTTSADTLLPSQVGNSGKYLTTDGSTANWTTAVVAGSTVAKITSVVVTDSSYTALDDTAVSIAGGYIKLIGTGFTSGCQVIAGTTPASSTTFISSTEVRAQLPATSAGTYVLYLVSSDGGVAIRVNGVTFSTTPTWSTDSTLPSGLVGSAISIQLSAPSNSTTTYALASGSTLPTGLTLSSAGLLSGTVTGITVTTLYSFSIVATDQELQDSPRTFNITISLGDTYFPNVSLLLNTSNTNTQANTTIVDSSSNAFAVTQGGVVPSSFSPYRPAGYWSGYFNGSTDWLSTPQSTNFTFDANFTIEFWLNITTQPTQASDIVGTANNFAYLGTGNSGWIVAYFATGGIRFGYQASSAWVADALLGITPTLNIWNHIAIVRNGSTITGYLNGVAGTTPITTSATLTSNLYGPYIGSGAGNQTNKLGGYVSNLRIVKGVAVYTGNFTPPTAPLTATQSAGTNIAAITGTATSLLTCQDGRFKDNSTNNSTITANGTAKTQHLQPFALPQQYTQALYGSSGYFSGSGTSLTIGDSANNRIGASAFTYEAWVNFPSMSSVYVIWERRAYSAPGGGTFIFWAGSDGSFGLDELQNVSTIINSGAGYIKANQWYHIAISRDSSNVIRTFANGVLTNSVTNSFNLGATQSIYFGYNSDSGGFRTAMYLADFRLVIGSALYTAAFTPPTAPLTAVTNTSILLNFNPGIYDASMQNLVTTVGDAQVSTAVQKWGSTSMKFDGTGDYVLVPNAPQINFGTSDLTIEFWFYYSTAQSTVANLFSYTNGTDYGIIVHNNLTAYPNVVTMWCNTYGTGPFITGTTTLTTSTWYHFALTRASGVWRMFINGVQQGSNYTNAATPDRGYELRVGGDNNSAGRALTGYMQDFRITKGVARYTSAFTPPTQAFVSK